MQLAEQILTQINESVSPCDNFYEFACGRLDNSMRIPLDKDYTDWESEANDKVFAKLKSN